MTTPTNKHTIALSLFVLLCGVYFLTYFGDRISNDSNYLFDSTESFVKRGQFDITIHYDLLGADTPEDGNPLPPSQQEPLQSLLATPLYWIAQHTPGIGLAHTVWLFNIFVTAATAVLLFYGTMQLGYSTRIALFTALIFGLSTIAWPYSRTFFREPLAGLWLLVITLSMLRLIRNKGQQLILSISLIVMSIIALMLTKSVLIVAVLPLMLIALPRNRRRIVLIMGGLGILIIAIFVIANIVGIQRLQITYLLNLLEDTRWDFVLESFLGYTISPGRSIFVFSPVLLLSIGGGMLLYRHKQWRLPTAIFFSVLLVILSYGLGRGAIWWGGNSWGPRHMVPLIPMLMLLLPPMLKKLQSYRRLQYAVIGLIAISTLIQVLGVLVSIYAHYNVLAINAINVGEGGIWQWRWSPIPQHLSLLDFSQLDVAWNLGTDNGLPAIVITLVLIGVATFALMQKRLFLAGLAFVALPVVLWSGLQSLDEDPRYLLGNQDALAMVDLIENTIDDDDLILVQATTFSRALMNYYKGNATFVSLPYIPGENFDPTVDDEGWRDTPPEDLLGEDTPMALVWAQANYNTIWAILDAVPEAPNELRVLERVLLDRFYPISRVEVRPTARLASYAVASNITERPQDIAFGDQLTIPYYVSPRSESLSPDDTLIIRLYWRLQDEIARDYLISVRLAPVDGPPIVQRDGRPQDGFGLTSTWETDTLYPDNHALQIPADAPPGEYEIQIVVYTYPELERLSTADGEEVAVLRTITISE